MYREPHVVHLTPWLPQDPPPLRFVVPIAGSTLVDDTLSIWLGAVRESGYLGHIPNFLEVLAPRFIPL